MYCIIEGNGDTLPVPQIIFSRLCAPGASEVRFRVALYVLMQKQADAGQTAKALGLRRQETECALEYWEGAGLLQRMSTPRPEVTVPQRQRLTTAQASQAAQEDTTLAALYGEVQRIFGGVVSQSDYNIFATLYMEDQIPADLILLASSYSAAQGKASARYIEKLLLAWRRDGITTSSEADAYLQVLAKRQKHESDVAKLLGLPAASLTLAERRRITSWYEDFGYGKKMIESARLAAGDKSEDIAYLNGILKKWNGKGYRNPRDVQQGEDNRNLMVQTSRGSIAPEEDILLNAQGYVPLHRKAKGAPEI